MNPIDVVRSQEAAQIKHMENHRLQHAQDQVGRSFQDMIASKQNKPNKAEKSEEKEYRYDAREKGSNEYRGTGQQRDKKEKENKNESKDPQRSGGIDILI